MRGWPLGFVLLGIAVPGCAGALSSVDGPYFAEVRDGALRIYTKKEYVVENPISTAVRLHDKGSFTQYCEVLSISGGQDGQLDVVLTLSGGTPERKRYRPDDKRDYWGTRHYWGHDLLSDDKRSWRLVGFRRDPAGKIVLYVRDSWSHSFRVVVPNLTP